MQWKKRAESKIRIRQSPRKVQRYPNKKGAGTPETGVAIGLGKGHRRTSQENRIGKLFIRLANEEECHLDPHLSMICIQLSDIEHFLPYFAHHRSSILATMKFLQKNNF